MKKILAIIVSLVFVMFFDISTLAESDPTNKEHRIVCKKFIDLDGDKKPEKIVFDVEKSYKGDGPYDYSRVQIFEIRKKEVLVFSLEYDGWKYDKNNFFEYGDYNKNGIPEIFLAEFWNDSSPDRITIIEKVGKKYRQIFQRSIDDIHLEDLDHDGIEELYGKTGSTTGELLHDRKETVFKFYKDKYYPSYKLTWKLYNRNQVQVKKSYSSNPKENFIRLLTLDGCIGLKEEGINLIQQYKANGNDIDVDSFKEALENKVVEYKHWWKSLKDNSRD